MKTKQFFENNKFYIIRADKAGVFMGKIKSFDPISNVMEVTSIRRLYYWSGALDVTEISFDGVKNPNNCKFSVQLTDKDISVLTNIIEFHPCTKKSITSINSVKPWKN